MEQGPKTINELKQWYVDRNLPAENITRFFIGKNYRGAKAFGIYEDKVTGKYIVYKNKADGSRNIRYEGPNEEFAVNEIYQKLKSEIYNQKNNNPKNYNSSYPNYYKSIYKPKHVNLITPRTLIIIFMGLILSISIFFRMKMPKRGYYNYNNNYYYYQNGSWYEYDDDISWNHINAPEELTDDYSTYYSSYNFSYSYGISNFENSRYYQEPSENYDSYSDYTSDYDYNYDWDSSSSWDSGYTDWDSDW